MKKMSPGSHDELLRLAIFLELSRVAFDLSCETNVTNYRIYELVQTKTSVEEEYTRANVLVGLCVSTIVPCVCVKPLLGAMSSAMVVVVVCVRVCMCVCVCISPS